jgi:hypothetical protein
LNLTSAPSCQQQGSAIRRIRHLKEAKMSILNAFDHYVAGFRARRDAARTERMISSLPLEVQKDIGWPHPHEDARTRLVRERFHNVRA